MFNIWNCILKHSVLSKEIGKSWRASYWPAISIIMGPLSYFLGPQARNGPVTSPLKRTRYSFKTRNELFILTGSY